MKVTLKPIILVNDGNIFEYIDIKDSLYYLRTLEDNPNLKKN